MFQLLIIINSPLGALAGPSRDPPPKEYGVPFHCAAAATIPFPPLVAGVLGLVTGVFGTVGVLGTVLGTVGVFGTVFGTTGILGNGLGTGIGIFGTGLGTGIGILGAGFGTGIEIFGAAGFEITGAFGADGLGAGALGMLGMLPLASGTKRAAKLKLFNFKELICELFKDIPKSGTTANKNSENFIIPRVYVFGDKNQ